MINIQKQIDYWRNSAESDLETAEILISNKKHLQGLFFCHLCIEKIFKAAIVRESGQMPPRSHDLFYLASQALIKFEQKDQEQLQILMKYQLEGRYPEYNPVTPSREKVISYFDKTKVLMEWVKEML